MRADDEAIHSREYLEKVAGHREILYEDGLFKVPISFRKLTFSCEALIFVYLGMSVISKNHVVDVLFITITLVSCLVFRFIGTLIFVFMTAL